MSAASFASSSTMRMRSAMLSLRAMRGQRDLDPQSAEAARVRREGTTVPFHDRAGNREAQAGAAARPVARAFDAVEPLREARKLVGGHARRAVFPIDDDAVACPARPHADRP